METTAPIEKSLAFESGQTGVSYQSLFADYVADATEITIKDSYINSATQIGNLFEFLNMLLHSCKNKGIKVHLITADKAEEHDRLIDIYEQVKNECNSVGLKFDYEFSRGKLHNRSVATDTGWNIYLERGLFVFDGAYTAHPFALLNQELRKVLGFKVSYKHLS